MTFETGFQAGFLEVAEASTQYTACKDLEAVVRGFATQAQGESQPSSSSFALERQRAARGKRPSEGDGVRRWATWASARLANRKCPAQLPR